jgi:hypothetical protein
MHDRSDLVESVLVRREAGLPLGEAPQANLERDQRKSTDCQQSQIEAGVGKRARVPAANSPDP